MSNRRKLKPLPGLRGRFFPTQGDVPVDKNTVITDEARAQFLKQGLVESVSAPDEEKELLKTVPAKVDGTIVGTANLYDDGSVDIILDKDAPEWAIEKIKATEREFAYTMGTTSEQN